MRPAEGERHAALVGEHTIAAITVDLQDSCEARQMSDRTLGLSVRRIDIGDARRVASVPWSVITSVGPELPGLGLAAAGSSTGAVVSSAKSFGEASPAAAPGLDADARRRGRPSRRAWNGRG